MNQREAACKTCGGIVPNHVPSVLDSDGIGNPGHKIAQTKQEELRNKLDNVNSGHHECDDEGYGCKYEEFKGNWSGAMGTYIRCRLKREYEDEIVNLINSEVLSAVNNVLNMLDAEIGMVDDDNAISGKRLRKNMQAHGESIKNRYKL